MDYEYILYDQEQTKIELNDYYKQFWDEITILVDEKLHTPDPRNINPRHRTSSIGPEFENEVNEMIGDKSYKELIELETEINQTLDNPTEFKIDVEYWENVLKKLRVRKAKAFLEEMGDKFLETYKKSNPESRKPLSSVKINSGELSPRLLDFERKFEGLAITLAEDIEALNEERGNILVNELQKIMNSGKGDKIVIKRKESKDGQGLELEDEEEDDDGTGTKAIEGREEQEFNELVNVVEQHYEWTNQYAPRKPQYFNRVKVGYEWNKYNQTHYDQDNPPPKTVQGYKFNIFYPDLIDPTKAPEFHLEATDNPEFCLIRFHSGAPYEDIAFKILNREWDFSDKQGFKCIFEHNILHLYFNFRKTRYRR